MFFNKDIKLQYSFAPYIVHLEHIFETSNILSIGISFFKLHLYFPLAYIFQTEYIFSFSTKIFQLDHLISISIHVFKLKHVYSYYIFNYTLFFVFF